VVTDLPYWPEFLVPAPRGQAPGFDQELSRLCATPDEPVRASLRRVFGAGPWPASATDLFERPRESLEQIAAELADCHDRLIVPHWERIRSVLDADIAYHAGLLAGGGARALFGDLHPGLSWSTGRLNLTDAETGLDEITLGPDGVVLMPSVFIWPEWSVKRATSTQTTLVYPARGGATVWEGGLEGPGAGDMRAVEALLGAPRARLLGALRSPATTSALAGRFGVTPGAVSQHLAVLRRGGLVDRRRRGRTVLYQASELGLALLSGGGGS
jgi:DNA-binding transcriptional ArsR family regulator